MIYSVLLWILIWGGMYTGPYNVTSDMFSNFGAFFQGGRAFFPIAVFYICLIWIIVLRIKPPSFSNSIGLFFYYALIGIIISLFSPDILNSLYWGLAFVSPILFLWIVKKRSDSLMILRSIISLNYLISVAVVLSLFTQKAQWEMGYQGRIMIYELPFQLGAIKANGAARFALIVVIFSVVHLITNKNRTHFFILILSIPAVKILMQAQSRTALLGLAVASFLFVFSLGLKWQFLFLGPGVSYLIYLVGFKWRAQEDVALMMNLTGRDFTWNQALNMVKQSPFFGWGFHADRILLEFQHMHNSYLHALIQSGIIGLAFFLGAIISIWHFIFKNRILRKIRNSETIDKPFLIESVLILGALTARSFFESTAAFFGVDLLFFLTAAAYIYVWGKKQMEEES